MSGLWSLSDKLAALAETMDDAERANYKLLLGMAAGGLVRDGRPPENELGALAFTTAVRSIARLQPHRNVVTRSGVAYRGRPSFVTIDLLNLLSQESARLRGNAVRFDDHLVVRGGPVASEIAVSRELEAILNEYSDHLTPTGRANYLYYDEPGMGIDPHVDNEEFSINVIMMLEHIHCGPPSALVLYPPDGPMERIFLSPGEMIVLYADSIAHARERMGQGEKVRIVAFGFQPIT